MTAAPRHNKGADCQIPNETKCYKLIKSFRAENKAPVKTRPMFSFRVKYTASNELQCYVQFQVKNPLLFSQILKINLLCRMLGKERLIPQKEGKEKEKEFSVFYGVK